MEYISAREAADKWGISQRRVAALCSKQRIAEATMVGNMWLIPATAEKLIDARSTRYDTKDAKNIKPFLKWAGGKGQLLREIEKYYPFENGDITKYAEPFVGGELCFLIFLASIILNRFILVIRMQNLSIHTAL